MENYKTRIRTFIIDNFLFGDSEGLEDHTLLLDKGIIDSTGVLELIEFIRDDFSVIVSDEELLPENLNSIDYIAAYLKMKLNTVSPAAVG